MSYTHLTRDDRIRLGALLRTGLSLRQCGKQIGFSATAIGEEIRTNGGRDNYKYKV